MCCIETRLIKYDANISKINQEKRLQSVHEFIEGGGYFPNSLIISLDTNNRGLRFEPSPTKVDGCISKLGILYLPKNIDQHIL